MDFGNKPHTMTNKPHTMSGRILDRWAHNRTRLEQELCSGTK